MHACLSPGRFIDSDHPSVVEFAEKNIVAPGAIRSNRRSISITRCARPCATTLTPSAAIQKPCAAAMRWRQGRVIACPKPRCWQVQPGIAGSRRVSVWQMYAIICRRHVCSNCSKSDVFAMHGYTELYLNDRWVKATPAFNQQLCELFNVAPLEFDGVNDSVFHPFNRDGEQLMEYLIDHGQFTDVPEAFFFFEHLEKVLSASVRRAAAGAAG